MSNSSNVEVARFQPELAPYFEALNRTWIEQYFAIEEADLIVFQDPFTQIVEPGGQIFFVLTDGQVVGTCAVMRINNVVYELAKMAVSPKARGHGYGDLLITNAIEFARDAGAQRLMLLSNTRLGPAISLYKKHGFVAVPITDAHDYTRVDIQMELDLQLD